MTLAAAPPVSDLMARLPGELVLAVTYLYEQGAHMPLIHNAPASDDRHKRPLWRGWQRPELRPTLQQNLEHLAHGGLLGLLPASIGMVVADVDEYDKDGLADWMDRYPPLGDVPSLQPGRTHLYYNSSVPFHNRQQWRFSLYGISMENQEPARLCHPVGPGGRRGNRRRTFNDEINPGHDPTSPRRPGPAGIPVPMAVRSGHPGPDGAASPGAQAQERHPGPPGRPESGLRPSPRRRPGFSPTLRRAFRELARVTGTTACSTPCASRPTSCPGARVARP